MKERPILFSGEMIRAILDGRKTQTRRVVKPPPPKWIDCYVPSLSPLHWLPEGVFIKDSGGFLTGKPFESRGHSSPVKCPYGQPGDRLWVRETWQSGEYAGNEPPGAVYRATDPEWGTECEGWQWRPSIFMPRWASRITLEITNVRVERVQKISEEDVAAEGVCQGSTYAYLWDQINGKKYPWASNPFVWCISFRQVR